jgi:NADH dehydrogenase
MQVAPAELDVQALLAAGNPILRRSVREALTRRGVRVFALADDAGRRPFGTAHVEPCPTMALEDVAQCDAVVVLDYERAWMAESERLQWRRQVKAVSDAAERTGVRRRVRVRAAADAFCSNDGPPVDATRWTEMLTAPVYGIGSDTVTEFLIMMRTLPIVPLVGTGGRTAFLWHEDLAAAIAAVVERDDRALVRLGGPESASPATLYERIARLVGRRPRTIRVPLLAVRQGERVARSLMSTRGLATVNRLARAFNPASRAPDGSALEQLLGGDATTLDVGLRRLIEDLPEIVPPEGVGSLEMKRFTIRIRGGRDNAVGLFGRLRQRYHEVMPVPAGVEPVIRDARLDVGETMALGLPGRGHASVRVVDAGPAHAVLATLRGHPVAGVVRFRAIDVDDGVAFEVLTCDKPANAIDWLTMRLGGTHAQDANWRRMVHNTAALAHGRAGRLRVTRRTLGPREAARAESWIAELVRHGGTR